MISLIVPIAALAILFIVSTLVNLKMDYRISHWFFEFFHLVAGFLVAMFFSNFLPSAPSILLATMTVGISWEIWELIVDRRPRLKSLLLKLKIKQDKITLPDTALDLLLDFLGGGVVFNPPLIKKPGHLTSALHLEFS